MTRLCAIALALKIAAPHWPYWQEAAFELVRLESRYHVSAELMIADAEHESRWHAGATNPSGATGLLQVIPRPDASAEQLLDWRFNLRIGFADFALARAFCVRHGYGSAVRDWLNLPTGWDAVRHSRCGYRHGRRLPTPKGIAWLIRRAATLHERES